MIYEEIKKVPVTITNVLGNGWYTVDRDVYLIPYLLLDSGIDIVEKLPLDGSSKVLIRPLVVKGTRKPLRYKEGDVIYTYTTKETIELDVQPLELLASHLNFEEVGNNKYYDPTTKRFFKATPYGFTEI